MYFALDDVDGSDVTVEQRAADVEKIGRISAVPQILEIVSATTGLRFAAVARVTHDSWTACAVLDKLGFGMVVGDQLNITTTLCRDARASRHPIVIEHASNDETYAGHPIPSMYGFESYMSVPIIRRNGDVFGTICALDSLPAKLRSGKIMEMVMLYAELISAQLEIEDRLAAKEMALATEIHTGTLREQFIALLGHDLRNPLFSIMSGVRLLSRRNPSPAAEPILSQMEQSGLRMSGLIDDMLDFARGRLGGGIPAERQATPDLGAALMRIVDELQASHPGQTIHTSIDLPGVLNVDQRRIGQLLSNLLANALTHGAAGIPVEVHAHRTDDGFVVRVRNYGEVIPIETMTRMFMPFTRATNGAASKGLGLGLYIASEIARSHGGTLTVTSTKADGTVVTFHCPN